MTMKQINNSNYFITSDGNVINNKTKKLLKPVIISNYHYVSLFGKKISIHRLVANHFLENPENKSQVNHKDGNTFNNNVENLEWVTPKENVNHAYKNDLIDIKYRRKLLTKVTKLHKDKYGTHPSAKLSIDDIKQIKHLLKSGLYQEDIAKKFNISRSMISHINTGKYWKNISDSL